MGAIVIVEGVTGAGKSTFVRLHSQRYNLRAMEERAGDLAHLYQDAPARWALPYHIDLLRRRSIQWRMGALESLGITGRAGVLLDGSVVGDYVDMGLLWEDGVVDDDQIRVYQRAYHETLSQLRPPDVIIFLDVDVELALERAGGARPRPEREWLLRQSAKYAQVLRTLWPSCTTLRIPWVDDECEFLDHGSRNAVGQALHRAITSVR